MSQVNFLQYLHGGSSVAFADFLNTNGFVYHSMHKGSIPFQSTIINRNKKSGGSILSQSQLETFLLHTTLPSEGWDDLHSRYKFAKELMGDPKVEQKMPVSINRNDKPRGHGGLLRGKKITLNPINLSDLDVEAGEEKPPKKFGKGVPLPDLKKQMGITEGKGLKTSKGKSQGSNFGKGVPLPNLKKPDTDHLTNSKNPLDVEIDVINDDASLDPDIANLLNESLDLEGDAFDILNVRTVNNVEKPTPETQKPKKDIINTL